MITKEKLLKHLNSFPNELSIDELIEKLLFIDKLEKRIELSKKADTISEEELENEMQSWLKRFKTAALKDLRQKTLI